ncbi:MAG: hypothetical protein AAFR79_00310 [Pseudomonadota bacterium]
MDSNTPAAGSSPASFSEIQPINARVRGALTTVSDTTRALPRIDAAFARLVRPHVGQLMAAIQLHDSFDQRMSHFEAAAVEAEGLGSVDTAAVETVIAHQLSELATLLETTARGLSKAYNAIAEKAQTSGPEGAPVPAAKEIGDLAKDGLAAATELGAAAEELSTEAAGFSGRVAGTSGEEIREANLDWMFALYTMDEERSIHKLALAQAA